MVSGLHFQTLSEEVPTEPTFYLSKTGQYENVTELKIGGKTHMQLGIHLPAGNTGNLQNKHSNYVFD